jgi:hypothetical protein
MEEKRLTYEEFLQKPKSFVKDMLYVMNIKIKYQLEFTEQEKEINQYLLQHDEEIKLNSLRGHFEKCLKIEGEDT